MTEPRVGVVVLTHDRADAVTRTLTHMRSLPERPLLVVVDNGSLDGTSALVAQRFPSVTLVRLAANAGAAGRNAGVARVTAPYVAFCDDDTWWAPGSLRHGADLLDAHPRLAVITARVVVGPAEREDPTCTEMAASPLDREPGLPGTPILGFLAGASIMRRDAFLAVGGYEPRLFLGGEEALVAVDLVTRGWALAYVPELTVHHHPSPRRESRRRHRLLVRNALWFAWLRRPARRALRLTARTVLAERASVTGLQGCAAALAGAAWVRRARRVVPAHVERMLERLERPRSPHVRALGPPPVGVPPPPARGDPTRAA
jgi:GT2 family glycosyltransferase